MEPKTPSNLSTVAGDTFTGGAKITSSLKRKRQAGGVHTHTHTHPRCDLRRASTCCRSPTAVRRDVLFSSASSWLPALLCKRWGHGPHTQSSAGPGPGPVGGLDCGSNLGLKVFVILWSSLQDSHKQQNWSRAITRLDVDPVTQPRRSWSCWLSLTWTLSGRRPRVALF